MFKSLVSCCYREETSIFNFVSLGWQCCSGCSIAWSEQGSPAPLFWSLIIFNGFHPGGIISSILFNTLYRLQQNKHQSISRLSWNNNCFNFKKSNLVFKSSCFFQGFQIIDMIYEVPLLVPLTWFKIRPRKNDLP